MLPMTLGLPVNFGRNGVKILETHVLLIGINADPERLRPYEGKGDRMPLSINVGLSRKASKDYQSTGVSINVTAELDQTLLARPEELQQQIASLYTQCEGA